MLILIFSPSVFCFAKSSSLIRGSQVMVCLKHGCRAVACRRQSLPFEGENQAALAPRLSLPLMREVARRAGGRDDPVIPTVSQ